MGRRRPRVSPGTVAAVLVAAAALAAPLAVSDPYLLKVLTFVGINVVVVTGMSLLFGYGGQISLGHGAFVGLGAYISAILVERGWPWLGALGAAVALTALGGLLLALPSLRLKGHYLAMATLGFGEILHVLFVEFRSITGGPDGMSGIPFPAVGGLEIRSPQANYYLVWGIALVVLLLAANVVRMRPGRAMKALHASEAGAQACGVDVVRVKVQLFAVSAALAGLAGSLYAHYVGFISPSSFSLTYSIVLVAMVVLGGMRSLSGAVLGAVLLTLLPYLDAVVPGLSAKAVETLQAWEADVYGLVLILVMLFMPGGLAAAARRLLQRAGGQAR